MASSREDHFVYRPPLSPLGMKPMERIPWSLSEFLSRKYSHGIPAAIHFSFSIPFPTRGVRFFSLSLFSFFFFCNTCHVVT